MVTWGLIVFIGLWLLLADVAPVRRAQLMGNPWLIHLIVIGSGLAIHGGSADGAMAAIVQIVQGSPEWHEHRRRYRNASETPVVLGPRPGRPRASCGSTSSGSPNRRSPPRCCGARCWSRRPVPPTRP